MSCKQRHVNRIRVLNRGEAGNSPKVLIAFHWQRQGYLPGIPATNAHLELLTADLGNVFTIQISLHHTLLLQLVCVSLSKTHIANAEHNALNTIAMPKTRNRSEPATKFDRGVLLHALRTCLEPETTAGIFINPSFRRNKKTRIERRK